MLFDDCFPSPKETEFLCMTLGIVNYASLLVIKTSIQIWLVHIIANLLIHLNKNNNMVALKDTRIS
jgi:hypothetical protein